MFTYSMIQPDGSEIDELVALYSAYLNYGEGIRPHLMEVFGDPETIAFKCADDAGKMVGIVIYTIGIAFSCGHLELVERIKAITGEDALIYTGEGFLVTLEARHLRVSNALLTMVREEVERRMAERNRAAYLVHELWVHPDGHTPALKVVTETYGITHDLGIVPNFYHDFHHYGYLCPICRKQCVCSAHITLTKLEKGDENE